MNDQVKTRLWELEDWTEILGRELDDVRSVDWDLPPDELDNLRFEVALALNEAEVLALDWHEEREGTGAPDSFDLKKALKAPGLDLYHIWRGLRWHHQNLVRARREAPSRWGVRRPH